MMAFIKKRPTGAFMKKPWKRGLWKWLGSRAALLSLAFACVATRAAFAKPGEVTKLAEGVYAWQGEPEKEMLANCVWVVFKDYVVVIDANFPWGARAIIPQIQKTTRKPIRYVLNTHLHGDHSFGNSEFTKLGATIVNSAATDQEARSRGAWQAWDNPKFSLKPYHQEFATLTFTDRLVFDDGTQRVEFIKLGPAHTAGDVVAYLPHQHAVVTGDLCVTWGIGNNVGDQDANYAGWLHALDTMYSWHLTTVVPGHGESGGPAVLMAQKAYLGGMLQQVKAGVQAGKSEDEVAKAVTLSQYGHIASDAKANEASVRQMYRHVKSGTP
jgi:cyclase